MASTASNLYPRKSVQNASRNSFPVAAATRIFNDSLVGLSAGLARPLQKGDKFVGLCLVEVDNRDGAASERSVEVEIGSVSIVPVSGLTGQQDVQKVVYASDDNTFTLTAADNVAVGVISRYESSTTAAVRFFTEAEAAIV